MYFVLFYDTVENFVERRKTFREEHLALAKRAHEEGRLLMAGALNPAEGALLVFRGETPADAEEFAKNDPYVKNRLIKSWRVREWSVVIGGEQ